MNEKINAQRKVEILKIKDILQKSLSIPDYQRPYKWQIKHIQQLANDLLLHFNANKVYRIGTVVIHKNADKYEIVDGQQRLVSLTVLLKLLNETSLSLLDEEFKHSISHYNIQQNYQYLQTFIDENLSDKKQEFKRYLLNICEMVYVQLDNLDEAFQFFDSQNARGKPLESYDLLKAYHLRAINKKSEDSYEMKSEKEKIIHKCVENWEQMALAPAENPNLDTIINQILFRLRCWQYADHAETFTSDRLDVFKGVDENSDYPYLQTIKPANSSHFQIHQPLLNGELFFDYIQHYAKIYQQLFNRENGLLCKIDKINGINLDKNLIEFLDSYQNHQRKGDRCLRRLFENVMMSYFDKFGEHYLENFINKAFWWVYRLRIHHKRIAYITIENEAIAGNSLFNFIARANTPEQVLRFINQPFDENFNNVDDKFKQIFKLGMQTND